MRKELQKGCLGVRGGGERKQQLRRDPKNAVAHHLYSYESVLWLLPGAQLQFAFRVVLPTVLQSANSSAPRPNYYLPTPTELEDEVSDDSFTSREELEGYLPRPHPGPGPEPESPLQRRLRSYRKAVTSPQQLTTIAKLLRQ